MLTDLNDILIRGEYVSEPETGGLDNVEAVEEAGSGLALVAAPEAGRQRLVPIFSGQTIADPLSPRGSSIRRRGVLRCIGGPCSCARARGVRSAARGPSGRGGEKDGPALTIGSTKWNEAIAVGVDLGHEFRNRVPCYLNGS